MASLLTAVPAHAATSGVVVAAAGSDTTEGVMTDIMGALDGTSVTINSNSVAAHTFNIPASPSVYANLPGNSYTVPGESDAANDCPNDVSWVKDPAAPGGNTALSSGQRGTAPFGSSAGRNYLATENGGTGPNPSGGNETSGQGFGCIDVARSSGAPRATGAGDRGSFEYYAFALDALSWATTSTKAPAVLTHQQIKDIYLCNITDWSQVGGVAGPIVRYLPQPGSGTRSFFISDILGNVTPNDTGNCDAAHANSPLRLVEENSALNVTAADQDKAILPYSAALWDFQTTNSANPTLDKRCPFHGACARLGYITTDGAVTGSPSVWNPTNRKYQLNTATVVNDANVKQFSGASWNEASGSFIGIRYVYNVLDNVQNRRGYQAAVQLLGFQNIAGGTKSPLCDSSTGTGQLLQAFILTAGFAPLNTTHNAVSNQADSNCRQYIGVT